jgi:hypothetical protein
VPAEGSKDEGHKTISLLVIAVDVIYFVDKIPIIFKEQRRDFVL